MTNVPTDPWEQNDFAPLDLRTGPDHLARLISEDANANPDDFPAAPVAEVVDPALAPVEPIQYAASEEVVMEDGTTVTTTNDVEGWHATVNPGNGKTLQVFHARTERELIKALMVAQANATKKINQQEARLKLVRKVDTPPAKPASAELTADQLFEIKTIAQSDFVAAFNKMLEYSAGTGVTLSQFIKWAKAGQTAEQKIDKAEIANEFFNARPNYLRSKKNENQMLEYLSENTLEFTAQNLIEAYDRLLEAGLLDVAVKPKPAAAITVPAPAPPPAPVVGIQQPAGRAKAAYGIRPDEVTNVPSPAADKAPSVEELENLPDDQIAQLFAGVVRTKAQSARRQ